MDDPQALSYLLFWLESSFQVSQQAKIFIYHDPILLDPLPDVTYMARQYHGFSTILPQFGTSVGSPQKLPHHLLWQKSSFQVSQKQIHSFVMIPSILIPSQMLFSQLDSTMDCQRFCLSLAPPWMTLRPYYIFCYLLLFQLLQHAITSRYHDRSHFNSLPEAQLHGQSRPKKCCIFCPPCVIP